MATYARGLVPGIRHWLRLRSLNLRPGIRVASQVYIAASAMFQGEPDGVAQGGSILVANGVTISAGAILAAYGGSIQIGANAYIGPYCVLYGHGGLVIGRDVMIGAHTCIVAANHGFARVDVPMNAQPMTREGIEIGEDVWVGSGCRILDGVRVGDGALIAAGSVVTKDIDAYCVAMGVPARVAGSRKGAKAVTASQGGR